MRIECENCGSIFTFIIENESWSPSQDYHNYEITCLNCKAPVLLRIEMPSEVAKELGNRGGEK